MDYRRQSPVHIAVIGFDCFVPALFVNMKYFTFSYTFFPTCMTTEILLQKGVLQMLSTINVIPLVWTEALFFQVAGKSLRECDLRIPSRM